MNFIVSRTAGGRTTAWLVLIVSLGIAHAVPAPLPRPRIVLIDSIAPVTSGVTSLGAADLNRPIQFMVPLKMRNYAEMLARVARGEIISPQEMLQKYYPLEADYQSVIGWLTSQGFAITKTDPNHLGVFVAGTVRQIQQALQVNFGRVSVANNAYVSAVT